MAKGSMRPGKEVRKPKKDAKKPPSSSTAAPPKAEPIRIGKPWKDK